MRVSNVSPNPGSPSTKKHSSALFFAEELRMGLHPRIVLVTISRQDGQVTEISTTTFPRSHNNCKTAEKRSPSSPSSALTRLFFPFCIYMVLFSVSLSWSQTPLSFLPTLLISFSSGFFSRRSLFVQLRVQSSLCFSPPAPVQQRKQLESNKNCQESKRP